MYAFPLQPLFRKLQAAGIKTGFGDETIRIGPVKYTSLLVLPWVTTTSVVVA
jgi:hypothetical protein